MATKKNASSAKKKTSAKASSSPKVTRVTTVKAVESGRPRVVNSLRGSFLRMPVLSAAMAEFLGVFLLAITVLIVRNEPFYIFITLIGIFMLIGGLSGAHINPGITVGAWATRRINWVRAVSYIIAQFLGAMLALVVMSSFVNQAPSVDPEAAAFGQTAPQLFEMVSLPDGKELPVLFAELIGLAVIGFAYASVLRPRVEEKASGALTIGGAGFIAMAFASTVAGYVGAQATLNPATAVTLKAVENLTDLWTVGVYFVAPLLGAVIGFFLYDLLRDVESAQK